jgi:hypothetical protein
VGQPGRDAGASAASILIGCGALSIASACRSVFSLLQLMTATALRLARANDDLSDQGPNRQKGQADRRLNQLGIHKFGLIEGREVHRIAKPSLSQR